MSSTHSPTAILDPTTHIWNTKHSPHHVQYSQSYCYIRSHHQHMEHTTLTTCLYVQSYRYIRSQHPLTKHTSLTTCPLRTVLSLYYIPPPTYGTHNTDHMSSTLSSITILEHTSHIHNKQH